jgi:cytochrome b
MSPEPELAPDRSQTRPPSSSAGPADPVPPSGGLLRIRIWDLPVRVFHWMLAALVAGSFISVKMGGNAMVWHERFGIAILALIAFRLIWGLVGSRHARFASFVRGPSAILAYLRGQHSSPGHSPLAALSVIALLGAVGFQALTGLFASDDIAFEGPLAARVSGKVSHWLTDLHEDNEAILLSLIGLHLVAIAWYLIVKRRNLIGPMITGDANVQPAAQASRDDFWLRLWALLIAAGCAGAAWFFLLR